MAAFHMEMNRDGECVMQCRCVVLGVENGGPIGAPALFNPNPNP